MGMAGSSQGLQRSLELLCTEYTGGEQVGEGGSARTASLPPGVWGEESLSLLGGEGRGEYAGYLDERKEDWTQREGRR